MKKQLMATAALMAMASVSATAQDTAEPGKGHEKCYGVARSGKNDCASKDGGNACAGHAQRDNDPQNWVYVPKGLCDKLAGGLKG